MNESLARTIGPINLDEKLLGKRSAGNPHAAFDEAGAGNVTKGVGLRTTAKAPNSPPDPKGKRASSRPYFVGASKHPRATLKGSLAHLTASSNTLFHHKCS